MSNSITTVLNIYYYLVTVPLFLGVFPLSLVYLSYRTTTKIRKEGSVMPELKVTLAIVMISTTITHLFLKSKGVLDIFPTASIWYILGAIIQFVVFLYVPFLPLTLTWLYNRWNKNNSSQPSRMSYPYPYAIYSIIAISIFILRIMQSPYIVKYLSLRTLTFLNILSITEVFDFFQSTLFHSILKIVF